MPEIIELTLTGVAVGGEAVGRDEESGKVVFVADAIPGERVRVAIGEDRRRWQRGHLLTVLEASPDRVTPFCPHFGPSRPVTLPDGAVLNPDGALRCGGCRWQHIAYERQLALKRQIVVDQLRRLGRLDVAEQTTPARPDEQGDLPWVEEVVALGDPDSVEANAVLDFGYCTQARFTLNRAGQLCLPARDGTPLPVDACPLLHPQLAGLVGALLIDEEAAAELSGIEMAVGSTTSGPTEGDEGVLILESRMGSAPQLELELPVNVLLRRVEAGSEELIPLVGNMGYRTTIGGRRLVVYPSPTGQRLFWPHATGNEALAVIVGELLQLQPFEGLLDLWAGVGAFTVILADHVGTVLAVEEDALALAALGINGIGLDNVAVFQGEPAHVLPQLARQDYRADVALIQVRTDPIDARLLESMAALGVRRAAMVTDNVTGLARSVAPARQAGFALTQVQPVDLTPQQDTVTAIALFQRR